MNAMLRDEYIDDSQRGVERFNKVLASHGIDYAFTPAEPAFQPQGRRVLAAFGRAGRHDSSTPPNGSAGRTSGCRANRTERSSRG